MRITEVPIANPCHEDWSRMAGSRARRHCARCDRHVHDLSQVTEAAARRLLERSPGVCVRYTCRSDGTVLHREHHPGRRLLPRLLAVAGAVVASAQAFAGPDAPPAERTFLEAVVDTVSAWLGYPEPTPEAEPPVAATKPPVSPQDWPEPRTLMGPPAPHPPPELIRARKTEPEVPSVR